MSDRDLLELAAKAAGYDCRWHPEDPFSLRSMCIAPNWQAWNPLDDDGDALRLAVRLGLNIDMEPYKAVAYYAVGKFVCETATMGYSIDAATRRAIVRAAAEIGRQMQEGGAA